MTAVRPKDSTNLSLLVGVLVAAPRFASLRGSGLAVCNFDLRTQDDLGGGQLRAENHPCSAYGEAAEILRLVPAGARVLVRGSLRWRKWHSPNGADQRIYETIAYHVQLLGELQRSGDFSADQRA